MSNKRLQEQNEELQKKIEKLQISLMNAESITETLINHGKKFDELHTLFNTLAGRIGNTEQELNNQKNLIIKSLQMKYGTGPTA